jgi:hypothetical protein
MTKNWITAILAGVTLGLASSLSVAQNEPPQPAPEQPPQRQATARFYMPPVRGKPGGTVSGATRGTVKPMTPLPTIDIIAPDGHSGLTASAAPSLYFYVSRRVAYPTRLTISVARQPTPVIETNIPPPQAAGIYAIHLSDHGVRLEPGIIYTWSISIILDPNAPSRDIVATASLARVPLDPDLDAVLRAAPAWRRAALFASAGLWYDAVTAAAELNQHAVLDELLTEVGLTRPLAGSPTSSALAK